MEKNKYQIKLRYGMEETENGDFFHVFRVLPEDAPMDFPHKCELFDEMREELDAAEDDFLWGWMYVNLPDEVVEQIRSDN